jgi:hypothetical protein
MKLRIKPLARNALTLASRRYNIGREEIVEIAAARSAAKEIEL